MDISINELLTVFITFFTVIDPIGTIPVFIAVTNGFENSHKKRIARKAAFVAAGVLTFFVLAGEIILNAIKVPLYSFQIAGGIVLFLFALTMIFGESKPDEEIGKIGKQDDKAIFPLAMPSLASPGAILACILLTKNDENSFLEQTSTWLMMIAVIAIAWTFMLFASKINQLIGSGGAAIVSRVMGLILTAVAVEYVLDGLKYIL